MNLHQYPAAGSGVLGLDVEPQDTFISVYEDVWQVLKGHSALYVYMALKRRVNPGNTSWFSTRRVLADEAGVSVNTFDRGVQHLVSLDLVVVQHRFVPVGWKGDVSQVVFERDEGHPQQIGSLFHVRFHLPTPPQKWGHPLPSNGDTPSPDLGNRHRTLDIDPRRGGGTEVEVTGAAAPDSPSPESSPPPPPADAGATPDMWCTSEHPRCREHAHIPAGEEVPSCRQCGNVRKWFEDQAALAVDVKRRAIENCPTCDDRGLIETADTTGRPVAALCDHQRPPQPVDGPEAHMPVSDASTRRRMIEGLRRGSC